MPTVVQCEGCEKKFKLPDDSKARSRKCPVCGDVIQIKSQKKRKSIAQQEDDWDLLAVDVDDYEDDEPYESQRPARRPKSKSSRRKKTSTTRRQSPANNDLIVRLFGGVVLLGLAINTWYMHSTTDQGRDYFADMVMNAGFPFFFIGIFIALPALVFGENPDSEARREARRVGQKYLLIGLVKLVVGIGIAMSLVAKGKRPESPVPGLVAILAIIGGAALFCLGILAVISGYNYKHYTNARIR